MGQGDIVGTSAASGSLDGAANCRAGLVGLRDYNIQASQDFCKDFIVSFLGRLRVRIKLVLLVGVSLAGMVAMVAIDTVSTHSHLIEARVDKLQSVVDATVSVAEALQRQVDAKTMTRDEEMARLRDLIHGLRYDQGNGYVVMESLDADVLIHGGHPEFEGHPEPALMGNGQPLRPIIREMVRGPGSGIISYLQMKPGESKLQPKISYLLRSQPLNAVFLAGAYVDDIEHAFWSRMTMLIVAGGAIMLVTLMVGWLVDRDLAGSLGRLRSAMVALARGDLATAIPGAERRDEVGAMAKAVQVFKDSMGRAERLTAEQEQAKAAAAAAQREAMLRTADTFEAKVGKLVETVSTAAGELQATAQSMSSTATQTNGQAMTVAAAAEEASAGVATVAAAAEELAASIGEIGRQVIAVVQDHRPGGGGCATHGRDRAGAGRGGREDRSRGRADQHDRRPDQPAGVECNDRSRSGGGRRQGVRGGGFGGEEPGQPDGEGDRRDRGSDRADPGSDEGGGGRDPWHHRHDRAGERDFGQHRRGDRAAGCGDGGDCPQRAADSAVGAVGDGDDQQRQPGGERYRRGGGAGAGRGQRPVIAGGATERRGAPVRGRRQGRLS